MEEGGRGGCVGNGGFRSVTGAKEPLPPPQNQQWVIDVRNCGGRQTDGPEKMVGGDAGGRAPSRSLWRRWHLGVRSVSLAGRRLEIRELGTGGSIIENYYDDAADAYTTEGDDNDGDDDDNTDDRAGETDKDEYE